MKFKLILSISLVLLSFLLFPNFSQKINATLATDWPMFRRDSQHSGFNREENNLVPPLTLKWKFGTPGAMGSPVVVGDIVFVRGDMLYALDANNGSVKWSRAYKTPLHSSPAVADDTLYLGNGAYPECYNCGIEAIDKNHGQLKWSIDISPRGARDPNVFNGVLYFGSDDHYVRAVNTSNAQLLWTSPYLNDGITAVPAVANGKVYVGTWSGRLYSLDSSSGLPLWDFLAGGVIFSSPAIIGDTLYVGSGAAIMYALDANTGSIRWQFTQATDSVWSSPAVAYNIVFIQDLAGKIFALDAESGALIWTFQTGAARSSSYSSPAVANSVVYIGSQDGSLYTLNAFDGTLLWKYTTGGPIKSSPAVANGMVYVGSDDGYLYAFENEGPPAVPTIGPFELPYNYTGRLESSPDGFKNAFWNRLTAAFDHVLRGGTFRPLTGNAYSPSACLHGTVGITCYDSHNGTDFSQNGGQDVYSVDNGTVSYTSAHNATSCIPNKGGFGCVVIINYPNGTFGLFAHLDKIFVNQDNSVTPSRIIGEMGNTGCPSCGEHLHFGVLRPVGLTLLSSKMTRRDWQELLYRIKPDPSPRFRPACIYTAPNGTRFSFQDPSGWKGTDSDPWAQPAGSGGCGVSSPYLWKYDIGTKL